MQDDFLSWTSTFLVPIIILSVLIGLFEITCLQRPLQMDWTVVTQDSPYWSGLLVVMALNKIISQFLNVSF